MESIYIYKMAANFMFPDEHIVEQLIGAPGELPVFNPNAALVAGLPRMPNIIREMGRDTEFENWAASLELQDRRQDVDPEHLGDRRIDGTDGVLEANIRPWLVSFYNNPVQRNEMGLSENTVNELTEHLNTVREQRGAEFRARQELVEAEAAAGGPPVGATAVPPPGFMRGGRRNKKRNTRRRKRKTQGRKKTSTQSKRKKYRRRRKTKSRKQKKRR